MLLNKANRWCLVCICENIALKVVHFQKGMRSFALRKRNTINSTIMKGLSILAAFLGGAAVGAACGILFAPDKGTDTRERIAEAIRKRGIRLNSKEMAGLVDDIADELQPANA